jgi:hypothetical protein
MRQNMRHSGNRSKGLVSQLAAEKKKVVMALCLIGVMAFMWIRVLTKNAPEAAGAALTAEQSSAADQPNPESKISFIELPKVAGRNDAIVRDFFASDDWRYFVDGRRKRAGIEEVNIVSRGGNEELIREVAEKVRLEAILLSKNPCARINDDVLFVGDKLLVGDGVDRLECDVVSIEENTVVIKCEEAEITLKLVQQSMADN